MLLKLSEELAMSRLDAKYRQAIYDRMIEKKLNHNVHK